MRNFNLFAFGTFGNPNGFKQTLVLGNSDLARRISTFDLNTNAIMLFPGGSVFGIRKEIINDQVIISYSVYTYAKEKNSGRGGTFIGSSIAYSNFLAPEQLTIKVLNEFHRNIISKNLDSDVIKVNHSDLLQFELPESNEFDIANCREISQLKISNMTNRVSLVFRDSRSENLEIELKRSIELLAKYDVIYFTQSLEIAQFVDKKGIFKVMKSERVIDEIRKLEENRRKEKEKVINYFEVEKNRLLEEKKRKISEYQNQIEDNEKIHKENEIIISKSIDEISLINRVYDDFIKRISEISVQFKNGESLDRLKILYNENKNEFIRSVQEFKPFNPIKKPSKLKIKTDLELERTSERYQGANKKGRPNNHTSSECNCKDEIAILKQNVSVYKWAFIISSFIFLSCGILSFLYSRKDEKGVANAAQNNMHSDEVLIAKGEKTEESDNILDPVPNGKLSKSEIDNLNLPTGALLSDVVDTIFKHNPNDIDRSYRNQKALYQNLLFQSNPSSFQKSNGKVIFKGKRNLKNVPCFKEMRNGK